MFKPETKAKIKMKVDKAWNAVKPWIIPITLASTVAAAWDGYSNSRRNERELRELREYAVKIDHGGGNVCDRLDKRISALEAKNAELLNEAMEVTEGKETAV